MDALAPSLSAVSALPGPSATHQPLAASLRGVQHPLFRRISTLAADSWQAMLRTADARVRTPEFALDTRCDRYVLKGLIPGASGLNIAVDGDRLRITGKSSWHFADGRSMDYVREHAIDEAFILPVDTSPHDVRSTYRGGILYVSIPRLAEARASSHDMGCDEPTRHCHSA